MPLTVNDLQIRVFPQPVRSSKPNSLVLPILISPRPGTYWLSLPCLFDGQDPLPAPFASQRLDCKFVPRVVFAQKDLIAFRQSSALWPAHELCLAGWAANRTSKPLSSEFRFKQFGKWRRKAGHGSVEISRQDLNQYLMYSSKLHSRISVDYDIPPDHIGSSMP
jgi:hypothetical protein